MTGAMKAIFLLALAFSAVSASPLEEFNQYTAKYGKVYTPAEYEARFDAFKVLCVGWQTSARSSR